MGTVPAERGGSWVARFSGVAVRLRGRLAEVGLFGRLALALALLGILFALLQLAPRATGPAIAPLYGGYRFTAEESQRVLRALEAKGLTARSHSGRIEISAADSAEAHAAVEKAGLAPRSSRALLDAPRSPSLLASQTEIEAMERRHREQILESEIHEIDPALAATVILRPKRGRGLAAEDTLRATVKLAMEGDRSVAPAVIEAVVTKVLAFEPDLSPESLRIVDARGQAYFLPGKPELFAQSSLRAREQRLEGTILEHLAWIRGVLVEVQILSEDPAPAPLSEPEPAIAVNEPLDGEREPEPPPPARSRVRVVVRVPSSYYRQHYDAMRAAGEPSTGDLLAFERKTAESIRSAVATAVPPGELGNVEVDRIFPTEAPSATTTTTRPKVWPPRSELVLLATGCLGLLALGAMGRRLSRPRAASAPTRRPARSRVDAAGDPAARARELVRLDPAAAAGVLHRWVGRSEEPTS